MTVATRRRVYDGVDRQARSRAIRCSPASATSRRPAAAIGWYLRRGTGGLARGLRDTTASSSADRSARAPTLLIGSSATRRPAATGRDRWRNRSCKLEYALWRWCSCRCWPLPACTPVRRRGGSPADRAWRNRTGKERLGGKASDEQRVDNCKVPIDLRGPKRRTSRPRRHGRAALSAVPKHGRPVPLPQP